MLAQKIQRQDRSCVTSPPAIGQQRAAAQPLQGARRDQHRHRARQRAEDRGGDEQQDRRHQHAPAAELIR
jgi:hypothetical protein